MLKRTAITLSITLLLGAIIFQSCTKSATDTEEEIYQASKTTAGYIYYKKSTAILDKTAGSGHSDDKLVTRYNAEAALSLDGNGKVKANAIFAEKSLIVKDLYNSSNEPQGYAIMYKKTGDENADSKGWIWAVFTTDGRVKHGISKKGSGCASCHNGGGHIDNSLMNVSFP